MFGQSTYFVILIVLLAIGIVFNFHKSINTKEHLKFYLISCIPAISIFIIWDVWFVQLNIWHFNHLKVSGYYFSGLPIEHFFLYFICTFLSTSIYTIFKSKLELKFKMERQYKWFSLFFLFASISILYWQNHNLYTAVTALVLCFINATHLIVINRRYMSWFYVFLIFIMLPVFVLQIIICNIPIVSYNKNEVIGIIFFNTPIENLIYFIDVLLIQYGLYEFVSRIHLRRQLNRQK